MGVYLGLAFGPFFGGFLTQYFGWRSMFFVASGFGLLKSIIGFMFLGKDEVQKTDRAKPHLKGTFFLFCAMGHPFFRSSFQVADFAYK